MQVRTGLERLLDDGPGVAGLAAGARIGLLGHPASIDAEGRHALERLRNGSALRLRRLFAPEHGLWGHEQDMEAVARATERSTGLPVVSLYGTDPESLRPARSDLEGLDAIVCDLQDVGSRYYTFVYTIAHVMEAAGAAGVAVVVLDRPNPLGGVELEGPVLDPACASFVGRYPLPVRHGMTAGELARMFRDAHGVACDLRIVTLQGWHRDTSWTATGLPWVPPSPNMPTPATASVYPGGCLVEGTCLSEGRGTTTPFELVGAPWLDGLALATALRSRNLPGVAFRAASFRPMFHKHAGQACGGVQVLVRDPAVFRPFATYLELLTACRHQAPEHFAWRTEPYEFERERLAIDLLLGRSDLRASLEQLRPRDEIEATWRDDLTAFGKRRRDWLLYD